jgi:sodium-type flagellar protein MotY
VCVRGLVATWLVAVSIVQAESPLANSITYATRIDAVTWGFDGSKFGCQLSHRIDDFGVAIFKREAGVSTRFLLQSQSPRMKTGSADLISQPPPWLMNDLPEKIAAVNVSHGETPIIIDRKISERMLAELEKGMDLHIVRQPWYGDKSALKVVVPSVGFRKTYSDYLACLGNLLPVNFSQVEKKSLYYSDGEEELTKNVRVYLDRVILYVKEDPAVKVIYVDGHTDSVGVRSENLLRSKQRAERVVDYLIEAGVPSDTIIARWHGERYQVATNKTSAGKAKNRRVTVRLSKEPPHTIMNVPESAPVSAPADKTNQDEVKKTAS